MTICDMIAGIACNRVTAGVGPTPAVVPGDLLWGLYLVFGVGVASQQ